MICLLKQYISASLVLLYIDRTNIQGFPYWGKMGGVPPSLAENMLIPTPPGKIPPVDPHQIFSLLHRKFISA